MSLGPAPWIKNRTARILGWNPQSWRLATGGYSAAVRYIVSDGQRSAFVKAATTPATASSLIREIGAYRKVSGSFMPRLYGYDDDESEPVLVIEDLSDAVWPPPWSSESVDLVLSQIAEMHATSADIDRRGMLRSLEAGWQTVAEDPVPFLSLGVVTPGWLDDALPRLVEAERRCQVEGGALTHLDLRSDNMCFVGDGVKFVDWADASLCNPSVDLGFWLPSLAYEGGPKPDDIMPEAPEIAALVAGFFAARAGLANIPDAPSVRRVQRQQLSAALPWAQRALGLAIVR